MIAIAKRENSYVTLRDTIFSEPGLLPAPAYVEFMRVVARSRLLRAQEARAFIDEFVGGSLRIISYGAEHARAADLANEQYGTGVAHKDTLNLLDLMVFACAKVEGRPILCTGRDFTATDADIHPASRTAF